MLLINFMLLSSTSLTQIIPPKREFRGAWIATISNIDWPTDKTMTSARQISELATIMDKLKEAGINSVIFQIRTECDALYKSSYEPWSYWLTGEQGKAPEPYFDPLEYAITEAHRHGMELHAWFNPYRAVRTIGRYEPAQNHVSRLHPNWILEFNGYKILNPGLPEVKTYILNIISDVLRHYDVDGIHFDDYFYPYSPKVSDEDSLTFAMNKKTFANINDWRRNNINDLIAKVYDTIKVVKPRVKFGISPFGIIENKYAGTNGFSSYDILYSDPLTWLKNKSLDYIAPQLYWEIGHPKADYAKLLRWWASVSKECLLYIGQHSTRMTDTEYKGPKSELENQMRLNRQTKNVCGEVFFSSKSITQNFNGLKDSLKNNFYKYPALPPLMPWKDHIPPLAPKNLRVSGDSISATLKWEAPEKAADGEPASGFIIYRFMANNKQDFKDPRYIVSIVTGEKKQYREMFNVRKKMKYVYVVSSLDRMSNESINNPGVTFSLNP